jgi:hypothetical protein
MSDFLTRLVQRQWGELPTVQPRIPASFTFPDPSAAHVAANVDSPWTQGEGSPRKWAREPSGLGQPPIVQTEADPGTSHRWLSREKIEQAAATAPDPSSSAAKVNGATASGQEVAEKDENPGGHLRLLRPLALLREASPELSPRDAISPANRPLLPLQQHATASLNPFPHAASQPADQIRSRSAARSFWERPEVSAPPSLLGSQAILERSHTPQASSEPPVHVTIGRIEVTALTAPAPAKRASQPRKPSMSLQDYLAHRQDGKP